MSPSAQSAHEPREFASELKFLLDAATAADVQQWARKRLEPDPHAGGPHGDAYHVTSLYFDTPDFAVFHWRGWVRFSKFRIRRYGQSAIFLERKLKVAGRVAKQRTVIPPAALAFLDRPTDAAWEGRWFSQKTAARRLLPVCQVDYQRSARVLPTSTGSIRLTLDEAIQATPITGYRFRETLGALPLSDRVVLELKFRRDLPNLFRELAATFNLTPAVFSKYRAAIQRLGLMPACNRRTACNEPPPCPIS
ncbi:MAG: hypothetical protein RIQ93_3540 [Verrucomicrobiota bacterium]|jgi:hypothetical protein